MFFFLILGIQLEGETEQVHEERKTGERQGERERDGVLFFLTVKLKPRTQALTMSASNPHLPLDSTHWPHH